jgi:aminoglycoside phosphotransferase family enzyme
MTTVAPASSRPVDVNSAVCVYEIEKIVESASAFICIVHAKEMKEQRLTLKILRAYKDERYHYDSPEARLACQREALQKNGMITKNIYLGLARISHTTLYDLEAAYYRGNLQYIELEEIVPDGTHIDDRSEDIGEYALVMSYLPQKQRLDLLLQEESPQEQKEHLLYLLARRIRQIQKGFPLLTDTTDENGDSWGSYEQLSKKLEHNLKHFDFIGRYELTLHEDYAFLKDEFRTVIKHDRLRTAFAERQEEYVKQCHGDLKTNNIWLETVKPTGDLSNDVYILDAVDFNESYRNIDVLADMAMLVVDIEARDEKLGAFLEEKYLSLTNQIDETAKLVMAYYLFEKALVCAIMCIVYDQCERSMGQHFLDLAKKHAEELKKLLHLPDEKSVSHAA